MAKTIGILLLLASAAAFFAYRWSTADEAPTPPLAPLDRLAMARELRGDLIRARFTEAGLAYPAGEIFLRAFKHEGELELWARTAAEPFRLVTTFPIVTASGKPGPKRREGDKQAPEGFYLIDRFNPQSSFHLSLGLNYPNESDRLRSDPERPGFDIFIHGGSQTVGCLPLGDEAIEELYLAASDAKAAGQRQFVVHVFPARMRGEEWQTFRERELARDPALESFWAELQPIYDAFEEDRLLPEITVAADGAYQLEESDG